MEHEIGDIVNVRICSGQLIKAEIKVKIYYKRYLYNSIYCLIFPIPITKVDTNSPFFVFDERTISSNLFKDDEFEISSDIDDYYGHMAYWVNAKDIKDVY